MGKEYNKPTAEEIRFDYEDIIATSGGEFNYHRPGNGLGDRNHDHIGPPGQNKKNH